MPAPFAKSAIPLPNVDNALLAPPPAASAAPPAAPFAGPPTTRAARFLNPFFKPLKPPSNPLKTGNNAAPIMPTPIQAVKSKLSASPKALNTPPIFSPNQSNPFITHSIGLINRVNAPVNIFIIVAVGPNALCSNDMNFSHAFVRPLLAALLACSRLISSSLRGLIALACFSNPTMKSNAAPASATPACFSNANRCFCCANSPLCASTYAFNFCACSSAGIPSSVLVKAVNC